MNNLEAAIGQKPVGADISVRRAKMAYAAEQMLTVRCQLNVMKQAGRDFIKKHGEACLVRLKNIGAERWNAVSLRQSEHAALSIVQRAALEEDEFRRAGERGNALHRGNLTGESPMTGEGGEGPSLLPLREKG